MMNYNGDRFTATINTWREGLTNVANGHGDGQFSELIHNLTSLRRGILDLVNDPRRNLDHDCGWPSNGALTPEAYRDLFDRDAIANRVINLMAKECWQVTPEIYEKESGSTQTPFEKSWKALNDGLTGSSWFGGSTGTTLFEKLKRLDILSGIGSFGILVIGLDDQKRLDEPVEGVVARVEGGIAFNSRGYLQDSWMTEAEEQKLLAFNGKGRFAPLNEDEKQVVNLWRSQRGAIGTVVAEIVANQQATRVANLINDDGQDNPNSPKNKFKSLDNTTTSQQWFGTQFSAPEQLAEQPAPAGRKVTFMQVFDESAVQVTRWEASVLSPRFGQPVMYRVMFNDPRDQSTGSTTMPSTTAFVHWSRVVHVADNKLSNETSGVPRLKPVINNVLDARKARGSSAEGCYQSSFPILAFETHPQLGGDVDVNIPEMRNQVFELMNSLQRALIGKGGGWKTLPPSVTDPTAHINIQLEAICIQIGCPLRIFKGSERGELASSQDDSQWNDRIRERQNGHVTPNIICVLIDRLILMGVLEPPQQAPADDEMGSDQQQADPATTDQNFASDSVNPPQPRSVTNRRRYKRYRNGKWVWNAETGRIERQPVPPEDGAVDPTDPMAAMAQPDVVADDDPFIEDDGQEIEPGYKVDWPDLDSLGDMDRASIANTLTQALSAYVQSGAADTMPLDVYLTVVWQMDDAEVASIVQAMEKHQEEVTAEQEAMAAEQGFIPEAPEGMVDPEQQDREHEVALAAAENPAGAAKPPGDGFPPKKGPPVANTMTLEQLIDNVFCPTGEGGGIDATCSPEGLVEKKADESGEIYYHGTTEKAAAEAIEKGLVFGENRNWAVSNYVDGKPIYLVKSKIPAGTVLNEELISKDKNFIQAFSYAQKAVNNSPVVRDARGQPMRSGKPIILVLRVPAGERLTKDPHGARGKDFFIDKAVPKEWIAGYVIPDYGRDENSGKIKPISAAKIIITNAADTDDELIYIVLMLQPKKPKKSESDGSTINVFCPTGAEGGVDPSCSPGGSAAGGGAAPSAAITDSSKAISGTIHAKAADADKFASENIDLTPPTAEQQKAIDAYRSTKDCYDINNHLRGTGTLAQTWKQKLFGLSKSQHEVIAHFDKVIQGSTTKVDMTVMRGMKLQSGQAEQLFKPGATFTDNGFCSTTLASDVAAKFATTSLMDHDRVTMVINLPKGSKAYHMPRRAGAYDEAEMVLPRGSKFKVKSVERIDSRTVKISVDHQQGG